ncbi:MAG: pseudouridine synthase [Paludibacter sp.]|jgi:23S rRNA pseudouridine2605 synthase|nr:pseudouridine synthase [Paludibacter sp.]
MTNKENWQERPKREGSGAGRDGKPFEKRDVRSILKGTRGAAKFSSSQTRDNDRPSFKPDFSKRDENRQNFERRDSRPYENRDNKPYERRDSRPYENRDNKPFERRDSRPYENRDNKPFERRDSRPFENRDNKPYERKDSRPYERKEPRSFGSGESRPYERRESGPYDRRESGGYSSDRPTDRPRFKPRTEGDNNESFGRPRVAFRKPGENSDPNYVETRFDTREATGRRPRIRSGNYDPNSKYSKKKQLEYRRTEVDFTKPVRLNKFLANAGICSRREADEFIRAGVITVNGEIVTEMGVKVMHSDKVMFHNQLVRSERKVYLLLNKPKDTVTTSEDTHERRTVLDLVKNACSERIYPVGRLDRNTTGVLLLTNDGDLASKLTHPKYDKKKIYHVTLDKPLEIPDFEAILSGVSLDDEKIAADELNFVKDDDFRQVGIQIHSGQNRVVRRIFEKLGYKVVRLDRVFFAGLTKKNLPRGKYRFLTEREVNMLKMGAYE